MPLPTLSGRVPTGALNRWISFYGPGVRKSDGTSLAPSMIVGSWAAIAALSGEELDKAQQISQKCSHLVTVPYQPGLLEQGTIQYLDRGTTRTFQIAAIVDADEMKWQLKIYCYELNQSPGSVS